MSPKVYVILVNWNGWHDTIACLESLRTCSHDNFVITVCDNGSTDGSVERIIDWCRSHSIRMTVGSAVSPEDCPGTHERASVVLFPISQNLGFAGANNVALRYAMAKDDFSYVWILNNDTVVHPDALMRLVERMTQKPDAGMCGSTLLRYEDRERIQAMGGGYYCKWIGLPWHLGQLRKVTTVVRPERVELWMNYVIGASLFASRSFLHEVGLMSEEYFLYYEELDWALRARGRYKLAYAPDSVVYHKIGASIGTSSNPRKKSLVCDYYNIKNRIRFTRKHYPHALVSVYLVLCFSVMLRILLGQWNRVIMIVQLMWTGGNVEFPIFEPARR